VDLLEAGAWHWCEGVEAPRDTRAETASNMVCILDASKRKVLIVSYHAWE
jgi:hypothetical protein